MGKGIRITADNRFSKFKTTMEGDAVLFATGRRANFKGLNLEAAGVRTDKAGVVIDKRCRTSRKNIFACGDVAGRLQFTHMAEHMAKVAVSNALLHFPASIDFKHAIWCTYSDPELAHVGASEEELKRKGTAYDIYRFPFSKIDRAVTENEPTGMIKVMAKSLTGKILGVSILGANAGEMIVRVCPGDAKRHHATAVRRYDSSLSYLCAGKPARRRPVVHTETLSRLHSLAAANLRHPRTPARSSRPRPDHVRRRWVSERSFQGR